MGMLTPPSARVTTHLTRQTCAITSLAATLFLFGLVGSAQVCAQAHQSVLQSIEQEIIGLVKQVEPSVVSVIAQRRVITKLNGQSFTSWDNAIGSGVVVHADGYILTTANVVGSADRILISFPDGQHRAGELLDIDPLSGIAVIHVDSVTAIPVQFGNSDEVYPGAWAIMMGNAYGLPSSVSFGLVNGIRLEDGLLQVSALVNPGSTGGAVFSTDAKIIGLIAAELTHDPDTGFTSYGDGVVSIERPDLLTPPPSGAVLVIPINRVQSFVQQLIDYGEVRRSWLGVEVEQSWLSIKMGGSLVSLVGSSAGLQITKVHSGSPADQADLRVGDRILAVNDIQMTHLLRLAEYVTTVPVGAEIEIRYIRENIEAVAHTRLTSRSSQLQSPNIPAMLTGPPVDDGQPDPEFLLTNKMLNQWLMELQLEIQQLKHQHNEEKLRFEEQLRNEQMQRVN